MKGATGTGEDTKITVSPGAFSMKLKVATHGPVGLSVMLAQAAEDWSAVASVGSGRLNSYICTGHR